MSNMRTAEAYDDAKGNWLQAVEYCSGKDAATASEMASESASKTKLAMCEYKIQLAENLSREANSLLKQGKQEAATSKFQAALSALIDNGCSGERGSLANTLRNRYENRLSRIRCGKLNDEIISLSTKVRNALLNDASDAMAYVDRIRRIRAGAEKRCLDQEAGQYALEYFEKATLPLTTIIGKRATKQDPTTGIEFSWIPAGCFKMGGNSGKADEKPDQKVCLDGFWMGKTEVTNAQFRQFRQNHNIGWRIVKK